MEITTKAVATEVPVALYRVFANGVEVGHFAGELNGPMVEVFFYLDGRSFETVTTWGHLEPTLRNGAECIMR